MNINFIFDLFLVLHFSCSDYELWMQVEMVDRCDKKFYKEMYKILNCALRLSDAWIVTDQSKGEDILTNENFIKSLLKSDFESAYELSKTMTGSDVLESLYALADPIEKKDALSYNLLPYAYVTNILVKEETIDYHILAAELMITAYNVFPGAAETALWHLRRVLSLDNKNKVAVNLLTILYEQDETSLTEEEYKNALKMVQD